MTQEQEVKAALQMAHGQRNSVVAIIRCVIPNSTFLDLVCVIPLLYNSLLHHIFEPVVNKSCFYLLLHCPRNLPTEWSASRACVYCSATTAVFWNFVVMKE